MITKIMNFTIKLYLKYKNNVMQPNCLYQYCQTKKVFLIDWTRLADNDERLML